MKKTVGVNVEVLHKGVSIDKDRVAPFFFPIREVPPHQYGSLGDCEPIDVEDAGFVAFYAEDILVKTTRILNEEVGLYFTINNIKLGEFDYDFDDNLILLRELGPLVDDVDVTIKYGFEAQSHVTFEQVNINGISGFFVKPYGHSENPPSNVYYPDWAEMTISSCQLEFEPSIMLKVDNNFEILNILPAQSTELDPDYVRVAGFYFNQMFFLQLITSEYTDYDPMTLKSGDGGIVSITGLSYDVEINGSFTNSEGQAVPFTNTMEDTTSIAINLTDYSDVDIDAPFSFTVSFTTRTNYPTTITASVSLNNYSQLLDGF